MTGLTTLGSGRSGAALRGRTWRRVGATVLATVGLGMGAALATADGAAAATTCPPGTVYIGNVCFTVGTYPKPTATTTPPTTAPPLINLPPTPLPPITTPPTTPPTTAPTTIVNVPSAAQHLLDLANNDRRQAGVGQLTSRDDIVTIALAHSQDMARAGDIFHSTTFLTAAVKNLLGARIGGENVAYNGDIDNAHDRLMASPGHRANLLDARFSVVGFAVVHAPDGRYFITEDFIEPSGAPRAAAPAPAAPHKATAVVHKASAPRPAPSPPTTAAPVPTTAAPAPVPVTAPPVTTPVVPLESSPANSSSPAHGAGAIPPLGALAVVLLAGAGLACCVLPRHLAF